jgi:hypothetical protein
LSSSLEIRLLWLAVRRKRKDRKGGIQRELGRMGARKKKRKKKKKSRDNKETMSHHY